MPAEKEGGQEMVVLDACCIINLFATGRAEEILQALPYRFAVARYVAGEEVLEIAAEGQAGAGEETEERVALRPRIETLVETKVLERLDVSSSEEQGRLVRFAVDLDDGEAHTCALALGHAARVATDDKKAIRVFGEAWRERERSSGDTAPCIRTSELLLEWADTQGIDQTELTRIVRAVARRASFIPPRADPRVGRWMKLLSTD